MGAPKAVLLDLTALNLRETLRAACQSAISFFGSDHSTYAEFSPDSEWADIILEEPIYQAYKTPRIRLVDVPVEQELLAKKKPIGISDACNDPRLGILRSDFQRLGIKSVLLIPVLDSTGKIIGSFSLDWMQREKTFADKDYETSRVFSQLVGLAIQSSKLFQQASEDASRLNIALQEVERANEARERRRVMLEELERYLGLLKEQKRPEDLARDIVRFSTELLNMRFAALYRYRSHLRRCELRETYGPARFRDIDDSRRECAFTAAIESGRLQLCASPSFSQYAHATEARQLSAMIVAPIKYLDETRYLLFVADDRPHSLQEEVEGEVITRFSASLWQAIRAAESFNPEPDWTSHANLLLRLTSFMQRNGDLARIAHAFLTGITADYGLRHNRAILLLPDESQSTLTPYMSIGETNHVAWRSACDRFTKQGFGDLGYYLNEVEAELPEPSDLNKALADFHQMVLPGSSDFISRAWFERRAFRVAGEDLQHLSADLRNRLDNPTEIAVVPLLAGIKCLGVVIADNHFTRRSITDSDLQILAVFAGSVAAIVSNIRSTQQSTLAEERLRVLLRVGERLASVSPDSGSGPATDALQDIVEQTRQAVDAAGACVILSIDKQHPWHYVGCGLEATCDPSGVMRPGGISSAVMLEARPFPIPDVSAIKDQVNPRFLEIGYASAICLPLQLRDICFGVIWLLFMEHRTFSAKEIDDLEHYANTAAHIYDSFQRRSDFARLRSAAQALSQSVEAGTAQRIPREGMLVAGADAVTFWPYDSATNSFNVQEMFCFGLDPSQLSPPRAGGRTYRLLTEKYHCVSDLLSIHNEEHELNRIQGFRAFQGVCVQIGDEPLGVLYLANRHPRHFNDRDRDLVMSFSAFAAPILRADKERKEFNAGIEATTKELITGNRENALKVIVSMIRKLFRCGPVLLYQYDSATQSILYPPVMEGVADEQAVVQQDHADLERIFTELLRRPTPYVAANIRKPGELANDESAFEGDTLFDLSGFPVREGTRSCVAFVLSASGLRVGILFINYKEPRTLTQTELEAMGLFANHAAMAILYSQLHDRSLKTLDNVAHDILPPLLNIRIAMEATLKGEHGAITADQAHWLNWAASTSDNVIRSMQNVHYLFQVHTGRLQVIKTEVQVDQLIERIEKQFTDDFRREGILLNTKFLTHRPIRIMSDVAGLEAILTNLLTNAKKFTKAKGEGGFITIEIDRLTDKGIVITVEDTGIGIPIEERDRIFERFYQVDAHKTKALGGAGIGLHIVKEYVQLLGGNVRVTSVEPEGGTSFEVWLPGATL